MIYKNVMPCPRLSPFISHFTYYKDYITNHRLDRFLPNGNIEIVIDLTNEPKYIYDNHSLKEKQSCNKIWISGIRNQPITIPSGRESEMFVINFRKGMAFPFLSLPMAEITDLVIDGDLILDQCFIELRDRLLEVAGHESMFDIAGQLLLHNFASRLAINPFTEFAINAMVSNPVDCSIKAISSRCGYSSKHIIHLFKTKVGVAPKTLLRILRFQKALEEIESARTIRWTSLALDCGYFDQSHFISDFKDYSGFTPSSYLQRKNEWLNYVPVD